MTSNTAAIAGGIRLLTFAVLLLNILGVFATLGCAQSPTTAKQEEFQSARNFQAAWDHALGRLQLDQAKRAWGPPTSISRNGSLTVAVWHWDHTLRLDDSAGKGTALGSPTEVSFGERMELAFHVETQLLQDWKYFQWGPQSVTYRHLQPSSSSLLPH
jgi:hypothetical protein